MIPRLAHYLWLALLAACVASGCGTSSGRPAAASRQRDAADSVHWVTPDGSNADEGFPRTVTDTLGVATTVERRPQRIVSLSPRNTELLFAVGAGDQVVGVTTYCNFPDEARRRAKVGGYSDTSMSIETMVSLRPQLVVADCAIHAPVVAELRQLGIPVVSLEANSFEQMYADVTLLGRATGHVDQAQRLNADLRSRVQRITDVVANIPPEQRATVLYQVWDEPLGAAGPASYLGRMIEVCGGVNIVDDPEARYPLISHELVIERNPDVILTPSTHADDFRPEDLLRRPGWSQLNAVRNGRVYVLDGDQVSRFGPRFFETMASVAMRLYPEHFAAHGDETRGSRR